MLQHQLEHLRVHARPDTDALTIEWVRVIGRVGRNSNLPNGAHVFERNHHLNFERLADTRIDDRHWTLLAWRAEPAKEPRHFFEWTLRRREPDALRRLRRDFFETLKRQHQMCTAFGGGHRMDFVDDDGLDPNQRAGRRRREHEIQALWSGDEQVGWAPNKCLAVFGAGITRAHCDDRLHKRLAQSLGRELNSHQR